MPTADKKTKKTSVNRKWQKIFTPPIIGSVLICSFCAVMAIICLLNPGTKEVSITSPIKDILPIEMITPEDQVVQKFTSDNDYVRFGLYYANYGNYMQKGDLHIDIESSNGEINKFTYSIGGIIDNSLMYVDYSLKKGETYAVTIYITGSAQGITFFATTSDENYGAELLCNKEPQDNTIIMAFVTEKEDRFNAWYYIMIMALVLCYVVLKINKEVYAKKNK